jgi:hypothetical protein
VWEAFRSLDFEYLCKACFRGSHGESIYDEMKHCRALIGLQLFKSRLPVMLTVHAHGITCGQGR